MIATFSPSTRPVSFRPWRYARRRSAIGSGDRESRNPIVGIARCCASETRGHATAAPPRASMNARRLTSLCPPYSVCLRLSLQLNRGQVLGLDLNCSELRNTQSAPPRSAVGSDSDLARRALRLVELQPEENPAAASTVAG